MSSLTVSGGVDPSLSAQSSALPDDTVGLTFIHLSFSVAPPLLWRKSRALGSCIHWSQPCPSSFQIEA